MNDWIRAGEVKNSGAFLGKKVQNPILRTTFNREFSAMHEVKMIDFCAFLNLSVTMSKTAVAQNLEEMAASEVEESKNVFGSATFPKMILLVLFKYLIDFLVPNRYFDYNKNDNFN